MGTKPAALLSCDHYSARCSLSVMTNATATAMTGLIEFLTARYDEECETARAAGVQGAGEWTSVDVGAKGLEGAVWDAKNWEVAKTIDQSVSRHMAQWDPVHARAHIEAHRRIVRRYLAGDTDMGSANGAPAWNEPESQAIGEDMLRLLATAYAGHPDYREEWRP